MATIEEIKQQAEAVKNATQVGENTAERVGGVLVDLANKSKELEDNIGKKANKEEVNNSMQELDKKLNRNLLAIEFDDDTGELNAIIGQDSTISSVSTDKDGNVIIEQEII